MLSFLSHRLHMGILRDKSSRRLNTSRQLLLSFICCIYLRRFITTRSKSTVFLQENVFADKQHCQYIHQRGDFLCFSADNINYYIRNNSNCNSFRDTFKIADTIKNPTKINAGAVANPGIAVKIGAKKIARRNKKPVTTDASPVLAPSPTPAELSTNVVVVEVPKIAPTEVATASASSAGLILGSFSSLSSMPALEDTPINVPIVSNISTNRNDSKTTIKLKIHTPEKSALKHCPNVLPIAEKSVIAIVGYRE